MSVPQASHPVYADLQCQVHGRYKEFRLINLVAGDDSPIEITLSLKSLDHKPKYEALSYVWGESKDTRNIRVNGQMFPIRKNLEAILRRLRSRDEDRSLWIDAICINQDDAIDRRDQVLIMEHIYERCTRCIVWLGEDNEYGDARMAKELISFMAGGEHVDEWKLFDEPCRNALKDMRRSGDYSRSADLLKPYSGIFTPLQSVLRRSWWERTWTIQEVALPETVVMKCGETEISWDEMESVDKLYNDRRATCCRRYYKALGDRDLKDFCSIVHPFLQTRRQDGRHKPSSIELLCQYRGRKATNPVDNVYGFRSLMSPETKKWIIPNYTPSENQVPACYAAPVRLDIERHMDLHALSYIFRNQPNIHNLPSWVPDWSASLEYSDNRIYHVKSYAKFNAADGVKVQPEAREDRRTELMLRLRGKLWDTVKITGVVNTSFSRRNLRRWTSMLDPNEQLRIPQDSYTANSFLRTIIMDSVHRRDGSGVSYHRAEADFHRACKSWWQDEVIDQKLDQSNIHDDVRESVSLGTLYRRFFITNNNSIGLGPPDTKENDEIWILEGGKMPLILRKVELSEGSAGSLGGSHTLVGDCYVDGIMDGQAAKAMALQPSSEVVLQ